MIACKAWNAESLLHQYTKYVVEVISVVNYRWQAMAQSQESSINCYPSWIGHDGCQKNCHSNLQWRHHGRYFTTLEVINMRNILLSTVPKSIDKYFVVLDCNWANCAAKFECTLNTIKSHTASIKRTWTWTEERSMGAK